LRPLALPALAAAAARSRQPRDRPLPWRAEARAAVRFLCARRCPRLCTRPWQSRPRAPGLPSCGTRPARVPCPLWFWECSRAARRAPAGITLHAGAVAHQCEVPAFAARFAFIALGARLSALLGRCLFGMHARIRRVDLLELLRRRELGFRLDLECGRCA